MRICPIWRGNPERPSFAEQQCSADDWPYLSYLLLLGPCLGIEGRILDPVGLLRVAAKGGCFTPFR